jgi:uncharacterized protein
MNAVDQLCLNCGLCCDGALFADVELRSGDDPARLTRLGLAIAKKGRRKLAFAQPCACFDGKHCKIYHDRPGQCRLFECGLLKKVNAGNMKVESAMKTISEAKMLAKSVRTFLQAFGQRPERQAMAHCYSQAMSSPIDLSHPGNVLERHDNLMRAFGSLMKLLEQEFLR